MHASFHYGKGAKSLVKEQHGSALSNHSEEKESDPTFLVCYKTPFTSIHTQPQRVKGEVDEILFY